MCRGYSIIYLSVMFKGEFYGRISSEYVCMALGGSCNINDYRRSQISPRTSGLACSFNGCVFLSSWPCGTDCEPLQATQCLRVRLISYSVASSAVSSLHLVWYIGYKKKKINYICIKNKSDSRFYFLLSIIFMFIFFRSCR